MGKAQRRSAEKQVSELAQPPLKPVADERQFKTTETDGGLEVLSVSDRIKTVDDAVRFGEFDLAIWYVHESECTSYECPMKLYITDGFDDKGKSRRVSDKPRIVKLWRIKLRLKRRVSRMVEVAAEALMERMAKHAPKYPRLAKPAKITDPHMLEVSVFDAHFGKLAWKPETGQNYDLKIAEEIYLGAVKQLVAKVQGFPIERVLFPIGQDFFHIDNLESKTTRGTPQDADGRYGKIYMAGAMACVKAIDYLLQVAPVKLLWVPGNHDTTSSYHLACMLWAWYRNCDRVEIDVEKNQRRRKFEPYGPVVIGFDHGDRAKPERLVSVMLHEARELMATRRTLEIHLGHLHKAREYVYVNTDTYSGGVRVRTLPSLSGTDKWHFDESYVGTMRAAEAYLWSKRTGYAGHFSANIDESTGKVAA